LANGNVRNFAFIVQGVEINVQVSGFTPFPGSFIRLARHTNSPDQMLCRMSVAVTIGRIEAHGNFDVPRCIEVCEVLGNAKAAEARPGVSQNKIYCPEERSFARTVGADECRQAPKGDGDILKAAIISHIQSREHRLTF
jgi:hypothetical protein